MKWPAVVLLIALAACSNGPVPELLPPELGGWMRGEMQEIAPTETGNTATNADRIVTGTYLGADTLDVGVYRVASPAIALDFVQRSRLTDGTAFYEGSYIAIIGWRSPERPDLREFAAALRAHLRGL